MSLVNRWALALSAGVLGLLTATALVVIVRAFPVRELLAVVASFGVTAFIAQRGTGGGARMETGVAWAGSDAYMPPWAQHLLEDAIVDAHIRAIFAGQLPNPNLAAYIHVLIRNKQVREVRREEAQKLWLLINPYMVRRYGPRWQPTDEHRDEIVELAGDRLSRHFPRLRHELSIRRGLDDLGGDEVEFDPDELDRAYERYRAAKGAL